MTSRTFKLGICIITLLSLNVACGKKGSDTVDVPSFPPTEPGPPELPYCSNAITYSGSVTITGNASFRYREPSLADDGLSFVKPTTKPIRFAEVRVLNASGSVAQCATTDGSGDFSFTLPQGTASYTIQVNSRSKNSELVATVFDLPETKNFHSLTKSVTPNATKDVGNMVAPATGTVLAGAFNILDQLYVASEYLRTQVGTCSASFTGCKNFTVAPKIEVFWKKGFNPGSYFDSGPLSFYLPGYGRLFILGGENGDVDYSDTDHFDNSVILHEFGHFLEDQMFASDSPGGSHNGNKIIDPRLAWSEGWGNFLQAAIQGSPYYIDTTGNKDGDTSLAFDVNIENDSRYDVPLAGPNGTNGEGNFREFSVTRLLWDSIDDPGINDEAVINGFPEIWATLTKTSNGFKASNSKFRDIGLFHHLQDKLSGSTDWSSLHTLEKHKGDRSDYANYVTAQAGCATVNGGSFKHNYEIIPFLNGNYDYFRNYDFFHYRTSSTLTNVRFRLQYQSTTALADLDLFIYNESARIGNSEDIIGRSDTTPPANASGTQTEALTIASLPNGDYMIVVQAYVNDGRGIGSTNKYKIQISTNNGSTWTNLCEPL